MRIAFFSTMGFAPWGGSEELWARTAIALLDQGHQVTFNCLRWRKRAAQVQQLIDAGATAHFRSRLRMGRSLQQALERLRVVRLKYRPWLRKTKPDFVVISFSCHTDDPEIANACHRCGIPYAILLQAAGTATWISNRSIEAYRSAYANAERCFFVSEDNREILESNLGIDLSHSEIVDNPFNVRLDAAPPWPAHDPVWKLACVARVNFLSKSQDLLVRVLRQPKWRTRPLQVTLWGHDEGHLAPFNRLVELYGIQQQIGYGGFASDIAELWSRHHGLLLPSRMEGNSLSLIEAMLCGRMVITTKVGRAKELIDDGQSGFLAPAATAELIDDVLERAWQARHEWQAIGEQAARTIRQRHSLRPSEDFADRILNVAAAQLRAANRRAA